MAKTLDDFIDIWKEFEKVNEIVGKLDKAKGDEENFNEYYKDFNKKAKPRLEYNADGTERVFGPGENADVKTKLEFAANHVHSVQNIALSHSMRGLEGIAKSAKSKDAERFAIGLASFEPKVKDKYKDLTQAVNAYRSAIAPVSGEKPNVEAMGEGLNKSIDARLNKNEDDKIIAEGLKKFYASHQQSLVPEYKEHVINPTQEKLMKTIDKSDYTGYLKDNLAQSKKDEKLGLFNVIYQLFKEK